MTIQRSYHAAQRSTREKREKASTTLTHTGFRSSNIQAGMAEMATPKTIGFVRETQTKCCAGTRLLARQQQRTGLAECRR